MVDQRFRAEFISIGFLFFLFFLPSMRGCYDNIVDPAGVVAVDQAAGRPLMEIFSVTIVVVDGYETVGEIYGKITVTDRQGSQTVYDVDYYRDGRYDTVAEFGALPLKGPSRPILADGPIDVDVRLMDYDDVSADDVVCQGKFRWDYPGGSYNIHVQQSIHGGDGQASLNYVVYDNAVQATIQVRLVIGQDTGDWDQIVGRIAAIAGDEGFESVLFKDESGSVNVRHGDLIPLTRTSVAVPVNSYLQITADIYDYDKSSANDEVARGKACFYPRRSGLSEMNISGTYGKIKVSVTWS